jgi:hypothetical protein
MRIAFKVICLISFILSAFAIYLYVDDSNIINLMKNYLQKEHSMVVENDYSYDVGNRFVKLTDDFSPDNRQDLLDIFYTIISSGMDSFTFYCDDNYKNCINDVEEIMEDSSVLSRINDFVPIFNSFAKLKITYTQSGKITLTVNKSYDETKIKLINDKIDELYPSLVSNTESITSNIKSIHDYIINHTKYDSNFDKDNPTNDANNAYGVLFNGLGICTGYTDIMGLFLQRMGINNHKISNSSHVWNYVYIDGKWLHLDVTWDDPVSTDGKDYLKDDYFLINTKTLRETDDVTNNSEHIFDETVYSH